MSQHAAAAVQFIFNAPLYTYGIHASRGRGRLKEEVRKIDQLGGLIGWARKTAHPSQHHNKLRTALVHLHRPTDRLGRPCCTVDLVLLMQSVGEREKFATFNPKTNAAATNGRARLSEETRHLKASECHLPPGKPVRSSTSHFQLSVSVKAPHKTCVPII